MPWEGFLQVTWLILLPLTQVCLHKLAFPLQVIKRMFNLTNYKAAPVSALTFWASKAARQFVSQGGTNGWKDECFLASSPESTELQASRSMSSLLDFALESCSLHHKVISFTQLCSYRRGRDTVELGEWILFQPQVGNPWIVGVVIELMLLNLSGTQKFFMRCNRVASLGEHHVDANFSCVRIKLPAADHECSTALENVPFCEVHANVQSDDVLMLTMY